MSTKNRFVCHACGYDIVAITGEEQFTAKSGRSMIRVSFACNECGNIWSEVLNMEQYGFLKAKGRI